MKVGCLGAGAWGCCLANLLGENGHEVKLWTGKSSPRDILQRREWDSRFRDFVAKGQFILTDRLEESLSEVDFFFESVTSKGVRPTLTKIATLGLALPPFVITSKGIERDSGFLLPEVAIDLLGEAHREKIGCISGPTLANEVMRELPTCAMCASRDPELLSLMQRAFVRPHFRLFPTSDFLAISLGGAMKNVFAIACAISEGLGFGENGKAILVTRSLDEMRSLAAIKGCDFEVLTGLAGLGDLIATGLSPSSRNYAFGKLLAEGYTPSQAEKKVGMVVEGAHACLSALELGKRASISLPIVKGICDILYAKGDPKRVIESLLLFGISNDEKKGI